jgi:retinol dehydrogenase-12
MSRTAMGLFPPTPKYTFENIPNLTGKVAIVTGANTGIGKVTARELLKNGARVYIACRNEEKANKAMEDLKAATGKTDVQYVLDYFDLAELTDQLPEVGSWKYSRHPRKCPSIPSERIQARHISE